MKKGAKKYKIITVNGAYHSPIMKPAEYKLRRKIRNIIFKKPIVPIINNTTAKEETNPIILKELLIRQISRQVRWRESIEEMIKKGITTFIEIGTGKILSGIIKKTNPYIKTISINTP